MKKILSMILALALCLSLVGCGSAEAAGGAASGSRPSGMVIAETAAVSEADLLAAEAEAEEDVETTVTVTLSDGASKADGAGVTVSGSTVTITAGGSYRVTGTLTNGQIVVNAPEEKVVLALDGASVTCENSAALYVVKAKKVILSLVSGSENSLASRGEYIQTDDNTVDAAIFSKDDLTIKGSGALAVSSGTGHGIVSKDELKIKSGTITVTAEKKGMAANDLVEITGGSLTIASGKHGIHCDEALTISHGTVNITKSFEGLEARTMEISGGDISIAASDDGLNAVDSASGTEADGWGWGFGGTGEAQEGVYILISGGKLTVNASGDGIDSNGDLTITGGEVYVSGPTSDGDGALDYAGTGTDHRRHDRRGGLVRHGAEPLVRYAGCGAPHALRHAERQKRRDAHGRGRRGARLVYTGEGVFLRCHQRTGHGKRRDVLCCLRQREPERHAGWLHLLRGRLWRLRRRNARRHGRRVRRRPPGR